MALRPPSAAKPYDTYYSGDPGLVQVPDGASEAVQTEYLRKLRIARQTNEWGALLVADGDKPTTFSFQIITGDVRRKLFDRMPKDDDGNAISNAEWWTLVFRCSIVEISNFGDLEVKFEKHPAFGKIATVDIANALDDESPAIVNELARYAWERSNTRDPK